MIHLKNKWKLDAVGAPVMVGQEVGCYITIYGFPDASIIQCVCHRCELSVIGTIDFVEPSCGLFVSSVINYVHCLTGFLKIR
jgi:hypothetical protein